ncbi:MAG: DUF2961 domain-containing protein [Acidobacteria bacterium]|nr:DUF2961 domain-containing protein [Acidobacteriota bacterium]
MNRILILLLLLTAGSPVNFSQSPETARRPEPGFASMERPELLPLLFPPTSATRQVLSYDVSSGNSDGNYPRAFVKYYDKNGEAVIFDEYGPGCLYRQQMNVWVGFGGPTLLMFNPDENNARIKYYFDDEEKPRLDVSLDDLFAGRLKPFDLPLTFMDDGTFPIPPRYDINRGRFATMYYPFNFNKRLKITFIPNKDWNFRGTTWYQNTHVVYPKTEKIASWTGRELDSRRVREQWAGVGRDPKDATGNRTLKESVGIEKGRSKTVAELTGEGSIASVKINLRPLTKETFFNTNLKIYWDGEKDASVDVPLSYFFGAGAKNFKLSDVVWKRSLNSLFFGFDGAAGTFYSYFPMPYWKSAKIVVANNGAEDIEALDLELQTKPASVLAYPKDATGYFHARRTVDTDTKTKPYTTAFQETGRGHVVGLLFYTEGYDMDGDEFTYLDGSRTPQIHGSGTEDDHNQGWAGTAYQKPLWGALTNGYESAYRIYQNDSYIFNRAIRINYEYSSLKKFPKGGDSDITVFYYKSRSTDLLKLTDELDVGRAASEKSHNYEISGQTRFEELTSAYDGYEKKPDFDVATDAGRAFNGFSRFTVRLDPENSGVKLRRRINRAGNGVQTARVYVDGEDAGVWHIVQTSYAPIDQAWQESEFEIPARFTAGKEKATVRIEYLKSDGNNGEINEFYYWVFCYPKS